MAYDDHLCGVLCYGKKYRGCFFLGSSHGITSFPPQELYNQYGITSYNLGCEQQGMVTSYYWLKEALRCQSLKAVVLECYFCFPYAVDEPLNTEESYTRKANIRYHTRWAELDKNDYTYEDMTSHSGLKGFAPLYFYLGEKGEGFVPHDTGASDEQAEMAPLMLEYLDKIADLCEENNISLILAITPAVSADLTECNAVQAYADGRGLTFISFNAQEVYQEMDYHMAVDNCDDGHPDIWGAVKVTDYIGGVLAEQFGVEARTDRQWESTKEDFAFLIDQCSLDYIGEIDAYLSALNHDQYTLVFASKDEFTVLRNFSNKVLHFFLK